MKAFALKDGEFKMVTDEEVVHARLERLFMTTPGDEYGYVELGSRIPEYFWQKATQENIMGILSEIKILMNAHEKFIKLKSVSARVFNTAGSGGDSLEITLESDVGGKRIKTVIVSQKNNEGM